MSDAASTTQREQNRRRGLIIGTITLPFRLLGVAGGSIEWGYLNSGVHDAQRDHEFDRATVRTIVESVTALDAALAVLVNR